MSHVTDLLDHPTMPAATGNSCRANTPTRIHTCLYCRGTFTGRPIRGCCSGRCAYLEHDQQDDWEPAERDY